MVGGGAVTDGIGSMLNALPSAVDLNVWICVGSVPAAESCTAYVFPALLFTFPVVTHPRRRAGAPISEPYVVVVADAPVPVVVEPEFGGAFPIT